MKLVTSEKMREIDAHCIEMLDIPGIKLMAPAHGQRNLAPE